MERDDLSPCGSGPVVETGRPSVKLSAWGVSGAQSVGDKANQSEAARTTATHQ